MIVHRTGRNAPGLSFRHVHEESHIHRLLGRDSSGLLPPQNDITLEMRLSKAKPFSMTAMSSRTNVRDFMPYVLFAGDSSFHVVPFRITSLHKGSSPNVIPSEASRPTWNLLLFVWDSSLRLRCVQNDIAPEECHSCSEMLRSGTPLIILTNVGKKNPSQ